MSLTGAKNNPGPGTYEPRATINTDGNYFVSKFRSAGATTFYPPHSKRFKGMPAAAMSPGPGQYTPKLDINNDGSYFISKFHSSLCRTHYHSNRNTLTLSEAQYNPGPGTYKAPSEFGQYEAKNLRPSTSQQNFHPATVNGS